MKTKNEALYNIRHSAAHLLAQAVLNLYPDTKITIGPVTETGFFYDFLPTKNFREEDIALIEEKMKELSKQDFEISGKQVSKSEAKELFKDNQFKHELIDAIEDETVGIFSQGDFYDLCKGGHVKSTSQIKFFKLTGSSGSYWRADRDGIALQRITGTAFNTKKEFDEYLQRVEEAKLYDHRRLGTQMDLFSFHEVAPGMPFFHHKGLVIFNGLIEFMRGLLKGKYQEVQTPLVLNESLWQTSGHYEFYKNSMYFCTTKQEKINSGIRPMNCPGGLQLYKDRPRSYRELPIRSVEFGKVHRFELSGVLHGLFRVRAFTIDDAHIYCRPDQIEGEVIALLDLAQTTYKTFGFKKIEMTLATRPKKSMGSDEIWERATAALKNALDNSKIKYSIEEGEGAFYGPKIDITIEDGMGRKWQCGTIQIDFNMPLNFKLEYIDSDQSKKQPVMIHRAIFGSLERFMGILLEHFKGRLPFWISPVQARVLMITEKQQEYAKSVHDRLVAAGLRAEMDHSGDQISAQIRKAQVDQVPWMVVIGQKEQDQNTVTLRNLDGKQKFGLAIDSLIELSGELNNPAK
jgi:threonyl-tRNA synthetase